MEKLRLGDAMDEIWKLISRANKYIDETMPWALAHEEDKSERLAAVLYNLTETLRILSILNILLPTKYLNENKCTMWIY